MSSHPALQPFLVTAEKGKMFGFCDSKVAELVVYVEELVAALVIKELETKTNLSSALSCGIEGARQLWNKDYPDHIEDKGEVVVNGTFVVVTKTNLSIVLGFVHSVVAIIDKNAEWKQIHPGSSTKKGIDEFVAFEFQGTMKGKNLAAVTVIEHTLVPDDRALVILPRGNLEQLQAMGMPNFDVAAFGYKLDYDGKMIAIALNTQ